MAEETDDALEHLRDKPKPKRRREENADDYFRRIARVQGTVVSAKHLDNTDTWGKSDPYCVVKGIRANNHLVNIFVTRAVANSLSPSWQEDFHFTCPEAWGLVDLVGLKFLIYDSDERYVSFMGSDDFLGGTDLELTELRSGQSNEFELELQGGPRRSRRLFGRSKRPRITVRVTAFHEYVRRPPEFNELLLSGMETFTRVTELECRVSKAKCLARPDLRSRCSPVCVTRVVTLSGSVRELHRTAAVPGSLDPVWDERFAARFGPADEPVLLVFDVYGGGAADGGGGPGLGGHLGSAWVHVLDFLLSGKRRLDLLGASQLLETLLTREGVQRSEGRPRLQLSGMLRSNTSLLTSALGKRTKWGAVMRLRGLGSLKKLLRSSSRKLLAVECSICVETVEMPYAFFMRKPFEIREESDVEQVLPAFEAPTSHIPHDIKRVMRGERVRPGLVCGRDHVVWLSGVVHGATALPAADATGKRSPCCVVEGVSNRGHRVFVHRTRHLCETLCPNWHESFYLAVPGAMVINKVMFFVFDRVEGEVQAEGSGEDEELLGHAVVDLCYVLNGVRLHEDVPLVGGRQRQRPELRGSPSSFHRTPSISIEVRAERRVQPYFERYSGKAMDTTSLRERHLISRKPGILGFADASQEDRERQIEAPRRVLLLHMTGQLGGSASEHARERYQQWVEQCDQGIFREEPRLVASLPGQPQLSDTDADADPFADPEQQEEESDNGQEDFRNLSGIKQRLRPAPRPVSPLNVQVMLGGKQRAATALSQFAQGKEWLQGLRFHADFEKAVGVRTQGVCQKPPVQVLTQVADAAPTIHVGSSHAQSNHLD